MTLLPKLITICAYKVNAHLLKQGNRYFWTITNLSDYTSDLCWWLLEFVAVDEYKGRIYKVLRVIRANSNTTSRKILSKQVNGGVNNHTILPISQNYVNFSKVGHYKYMSVKYKLHKVIYVI